MNRLTESLGFVADLVANDHYERATPTLVVGDMKRWKSLNEAIPDIKGFIFIDFDDVTSETLQKIAPQVVLSAVLGHSFDAVEIAKRLTGLGYLGRYRVISDGYPDPKLIEKEIATLTPKLDFAVLNYDSIRCKS